MDGWPTRDVLSHRVRSTPDATAVVDASDGTELPFRAVDAAVDRTVAATGTLLADRDRVGAGRPRVGIAAETNPAFVVALFAAWRAGAVAIPLSTAGPRSDRQQRVDRLGLDLAFDPGSDGFGDVDLGCPAVGVEPAFDAERTDPGDATPEARWEPTETALILFTSGTTGRPKGVRLTHRNLVASATASAFRLGVTPGDRWHCCLPAHHMGGLAPIVRSTLYGSAVVLESTFDAERSGEAMATHSATGVSLVPTMLRRMLDRGWTPQEELRFVLLGGAPASAALVEDCEQAGVPVYPTYGTTETASQIATATPEEAFKDPDTVGTPLLAAEVTIVDPAEGTPVEAGLAGELVVDGPIVTPGYLDDDATRAAVGEFGLHTGDVARRDDRGRLSILGRLDDAIQTGGETVHPGRVGDALCGLPTVADAAVVGVPDDEWGERVVALVVPDGVADPDGDVIRDRLSGELESYEVPKAVRIADALPRTESGTVDREAVRTRFRS